jgi:hypothetical protein
MGFAGYGAFCVQLYCRQTTRKGKQTNTHARNNKINKEKQNKKHKWKRAKCDHVQEKETKTSEADPFTNMKVKISYTPEDGHVG